jgi:hypothetical protein
MIADGSLAGVHIFFPDPWHKARHNKRRLIQPPFVKLLCEKLAPGSYIHCATDWEDYAVQMLEVLGAEPMLANTAESYAEKPSYRPLTKFENRGLKLGHGVWDLVSRRNKSLAAGGRQAGAQPACDPRGHDPDVAVAEAFRPARGVRRLPAQGIRTVEDKQAFRPGRQRPRIEIGRQVERARHPGLQPRLACIDVDDGHAVAAHQLVQLARSDTLQSHQHGKHGVSSSGWQWIDYLPANALAVRRSSRRIRASSPFAV